MARPGCGPWPGGLLEPRRVQSVPDAVASASLPAACHGDVHRRRGHGAHLGSGSAKDRHWRVSGAHLDGHGAAREPDPRCDATLNRRSSPCQPWAWGVLPEAQRRCCASPDSHKSPKSAPVNTQEHLLSGAQMAPTSTACTPPQAPGARSKAATGTTQTPSTSPRFTSSRIPPKRSRRSLLVWSTSPHRVRAQSERIANPNSCTASTAPTAAS